MKPARSDLARSLPFALLRAWLVLLVVVLLAMCSSSESHLGNTKLFLTECSASVPCEDPSQSCFCFCTVTCEADDVCESALARAGLGVGADRIVCRAPSCDGTSEEDSDATGVCDVSCSEDADCAALSESHQCIGGYCRREASVAIARDGGGGCPAGMVLVSGDTSGAVADLCLDALETTVASYAACVSDGACAEPSSGNYFTSGRDAHPMNQVTQTDAEAYCAYLGRRLPARAEWQWAAQNGASMTAYPWGDEDPSAADTPPRVCSLGTSETCEVGQHEPGNNLQGMADLAGNVAELVLDDGAACAAGGSYATTEADLIELQSSSCEPFSAALDSVGFRCAVEP